MDINLFFLNATKVLLVAGGLNLGLIGLLGLDVLGRILGTGSIALRVLYIFIGLSALYIASLWLGVYHFPSPPHEGFSIEFHAK